MKLYRGFPCKILVVIVVSLAVGTLLYSAQFTLHSTPYEQDYFYLDLDAPNVSVVAKTTVELDLSFVDSKLIGNAPNEVHSKVTNKTIGIHDRTSDIQTNLTISDRNKGKPFFDPVEYEKQLDESLQPIRNESLKTYSVGFRFFSGFCNQYMYFAGILFYAITNNIQLDQILLESLHWKDTLGTNGRVPFSALWDIVHWNTYYPTLPKLVRHNSKDFPEVMVSFKDIQTELRYREQPTLVWNLTEGLTEVNATKPFIIAGKTLQPVRQFRAYQRHIGSNQIQDVKRQHNIFQVIAGGALRPHPEIEEMIKIREEALDNDFMALHARIEPDMLEHPICKDKKVNNMTEILEMLYSKYPEPPTKKVFLVFNRPLLEERSNHTSLSKDLRILSNYNLAIINDMMKNGMWNGTVKVVEGGANMVTDLSDNPLYKRYNSIVGAILSFFTALNSKIFIGTEISSYSTLAVQSRFYRGNRENYYYYPTSGLVWITDKDATFPPRFRC